jgi:hypothetical protein
MVREMVIGSTIGSLGLLSLVFGIQGSINPENPLLPIFGDSMVAAAAVGVGLICCLIEARILLPAIRTLAARKRAEQ